MNKTQMIYRKLEDFVENVKKADLKKMFYDVRKEPNTFIVKDKDGDRPKTIYTCTLIITAADKENRFIFSEQIKQAEVKSEQEAKDIDKQVEDAVDEILSQLRRDAPAISRIEGLIE